MASRLDLRKLAVLRPGTFGARVGFNGLAQMAPILATLVITPVLVQRLGPDRFGIWSLALIALSTLTSLDGGVSASLSRFFAVHAARDDRAETSRLLLAAISLFLVLGLLVTLAAHWLAPLFVSLIHVHHEHRSEAVWVFRWLPILAVLAFAADAAAALLQGSGQFRDFALVTCLSSVVFVAAVLVLVQPGAHIRELMAAAALRFATMAGLGLIAARGRLAVRRPLLPSWTNTREFGGYASRMQLASLTGFVNAELDGFVIAWASGVKYVGIYSIGLQAASAARSVPLYAFSPLLTRLTTTFRSAGRDATAEEFDRLERRWLPSVLAFGLVAIAAIGFSVAVWLGHTYALSGVTAVILLLCYVVHVGFTGMRTCFVRAVGRPGLEARYSTVWTVLNALLTVPFALLAGMLGVVGATALSGLVASGYFVWLCGRSERLPLLLPDRAWALYVSLAAGLTVIGELAILRTHLHGFVGLLVSGLPPLLALGLLARFERRRARPAEARLGRVAT